MSTLTPASLVAIQLLELLQSDIVFLRLRLQFVKASDGNCLQVISPWRKLQLSFEETISNSWITSIRKCGSGFQKSLEHLHIGRSCRIESWSMLHRSLNK